MLYQAFISEIDIVSNICCSANGMSLTTSDEETVSDSVDLMTVGKQLRDLGSTPAEDILHRDLVLLGSCNNVTSIVMA